MMFGEHAGQKISGRPIFLFQRIKLGAAQELAHDQSIVKGPTPACRHIPTQCRIPNK
jgi:hypothetical protein